ncbi:nuclear transport factor 2 family protein [Mesorhizobium onobrychidis]|uniref:Nuclear transport factor 2 family protein n=1 Tax=Mesorhizobium onobrychidis TaxID=2775404 RepID=A0ABY5QXT9_9HYPH|nr:nuclear transport factor 2 family protein [Mesorhizobium onobrychidis]UVC16021.1 nuclear transport factor 2 family protein [Mesorhizobium onobrychidis]
MTDTKALNIARTYFDGMANKDIGKIMSVASADIVCTSPIGQTVGTEAFRGFQEGFARMIKKLTLVAAFGDGRHAVVVYETESHPVPHSTVAEYLTIHDDKIATTTVIYDAMPFAAYMATVQPH